MRTHAQQIYVIAYVAVAKCVKKNKLFLCGNIFFKEVESSWTWFQTYKEYGDLCAQPSSWVQLSHLVGFYSPITVLWEGKVYSFYTLHLEEDFIPSQTASHLILLPLRAEEGFSGGEVQGDTKIVAKYKSLDNIIKTIDQATTCSWHSNITISKSHTSGKETHEISLSQFTTWLATTASHPQGRKPKRKCKQAKIRTPHCPPHLKTLELQISKCLRLWAERCARPKAQKPSQTELVWQIFLNVRYGQMENLKRSQGIQLPAWSSVSFPP